MKAEVVYQLTKSEYDILMTNLNKIQDILSHAQIVESKSGQPVRNCFVQPEKLTDEKMQELFKTNYRHIMYYNLDTGLWNKTRILGWKLLREYNVAEQFMSAKNILESCPEFHYLEIVAFVVMPIVHVNEQFGVIEDPVPNTTSKIQHGGGWGGTIVCRDKFTGKLRPVPNTWIRGWGGSPRQIPKEFAKRCLDCQDVQQQLIEIHTR